MRKLTLLLLSVFALSAIAQVTTVPAIIQKGYTGEVTIIFNPNEGNKGMAGATQCYAHTGLITSASSADNDWKHVLDSWRGTNAKAKMTKDGSNWKLVIPNLYDFYGCPASTEINKLAFVFHDGPGGSKEGKTAEGGDIFVNLADKDIDVNFSAKSASIIKEAKSYINAGQSIDTCVNINSKLAELNRDTQNVLLNVLANTGW